MSEPTPRAIWDKLTRDMKDTLLLIASGASWREINGNSGRGLAKRGLAVRPTHIEWELTDLGRAVYAEAITKARATPAPITRDVETLQFQLAAARREVEARDKRLAAIAARARDEINDLGADGVDDLNALLDIESLADGQPRRDE